jgi:phage repressor protein C with HTH and peptisase S24 domain
MLPTLKPGQEIIISSLPYFFSSPKVHNIIAFKDHNKYIIKRIAEIKSNQYRVAGDNQSDSKDYGWIERDRIIGKVIYIYA